MQSMASRHHSKRGILPITEELLILRDIDTENKTFSVMWGRTYTRCRRARDVCRATERVTSADDTRRQAREAMASG
jgi:hypothetical protein